MRNTGLRPALAGVTAGPAFALVGPVADRAQADRVARRQTPPAWDAGTSPALRPLCNKESADGTSLPVGRASAVVGPIRPLHGPPA